MAKHAIAINSDTFAKEDLGVLQSALENLGLTSVEVSVYSTLLSMGARPASAIAKQAGFNRTHTYEILSSLTEKGLIQQTERNAAKHFSCLPPEYVMSLLEAQETELARHKQKLREVLPKLEQLRDTTQSAPMIKYFRGAEGVKKVFEEILAVSGTTVYFFSDSEFTSILNDKEFKQWQRTFTLRRVKKDITHRYLISSRGFLENQLRPDVSLKREVRLLTGFALPIEVFVYSSTTVIFPDANEKVAMAIESSGVADTFRNLHTGFWDHISQEPPRK